MTDPTKNIVSYGRALAKALKVFDDLEPKAGRFERVLLNILRASYRQRLRHLVLVLPSDLAEAILTPDRPDPGPDHRPCLTADDLSFQLDMEDTTKK